MDQVPPFKPEARERRPPALIYPSLHKITAQPCCIKDCKSGTKSQPAIIRDDIQVQPFIHSLCSHHNQYIVYKRGWSFIFDDEKELINIGREYQLMDKIIEFANKLKTEEYEKMIRQRMKTININRDDIPMMEEHEERQRESEEGKPIHPYAYGGYQSSDGDEF